ncbi:GNAT family N-acetyltransferase [Salmonella enterica]|uniref:GNAT family N-acetyltransferase n=1 Tax=Salmonella enterica TaxID=28901 RepID=UPI000BA09618|nr:GNAT family N-acetyltransferase [Salmonella enterica]EBV4143994.1 GNAT family N-acetyltransferase [Salmonella enterica subsp. enterica serovar Benin]EBC1279667.1 GNAT family N-acetyltransferase [Salmonella enterica]EBE6989456.1 GNAT family N-acetyltransferase [Salmonella enterica]EBE7299675.1 GNAT family N-acetyltransferase [Salmonella enterica]EBW4219272.1 GNAT family N-acetyltransferase [Salmonella enterica subsp. enterica serovar Benin]
MSTLVFRQVTAADVDRCYDIEITSYEGDEAATREKIATRINLYPEGFLCMELDGDIIGFINAGCAWEVVMSDEKFKELAGHDPDAPNAVIMSVVVHPDFQGKGYSSLLMREFVARMKALGKKTIHLMCKVCHVNLYAHFGYQYIKPSESEHGGMVWHEMMMTL